MSAYVIDREHVRYLVDAAHRTFWPHRSPFRWFYNGHWHTLDQSDNAACVRAGQMLWNENIRSIEGRYPDCGLDSDMPGPIGETYLYDTHKPRVNRPDWVAVLKACHCYRYQSCEHEGWEASEAYTFIDALMDTATHLLPGYEDAPWGAPPPLKPIIPDNPTGAPFLHTEG